MIATLQKPNPQRFVLHSVPWSSYARRMGIYAAIGVREVWRFDGETLHVHHLARNGNYKERDDSLAFPFLPMGEIQRFLTGASATTHAALMRTFAHWVRDTLLP